MVESESYFIKTIHIQCELDTINFQAREIGFFNSLFENEKKIELKQFYLFFLEHAEKELEDANERLTDYRRQLKDGDLQQGLIQQL